MDLVSMQDGSKHIQHIWFTADKMIAILLLEFQKMKMLVVHQLTMH
jgi:hypothetical protein